MNTLNRAIVLNIVSMGSSHYVEMITSMQIELDDSIISNNLHQWTVLLDLADICQSNSTIKNYFIILFSDNH